MTGEKMPAEKTSVESNEKSARFAVIIDGVQETFESKAKMLEALRDMREEQA